LVFLGGRRLLWGGRLCPSRRSRLTRLGCFWLRRRFGRRWRLCRGGRFGLLARALLGLLTGALLGLLAGALLGLLTGALLSLLALALETGALFLGTEGPVALGDDIADRLSDRGA
jgi:hypothetical protein